MVDSASEVESVETVSESPRRKMTPASVVVGDHDGFMANLRSQLRPINEWTSKLHADLKNSLSVQSATNGSPEGGGVDHHCSSISVPSSPHHHHTFTFEEFAGEPELVASWFDLARLTVQFIKYLYLINSSAYIMTIGMTFWILDNLVIFSVFNVTWDLNKG